MGGAGNEQSEYRGGHRQEGWGGGAGMERSGMTVRVSSSGVGGRSRKAAKRNDGTGNRNRCIEAGPGTTKSGRGPDQDFSPFILSLLLFTTTIGYPNHLLNN